MADSTNDIATKVFYTEIMSLDDKSWMSRPVFRVKSTVPDKKLPEVRVKAGTSDTRVPVDSEASKAFTEELMAKSPEVQGDSLVELKSVLVIPDTSVAQAGNMVIKDWTGIGNREWTFRSESPRNSASSHLPNSGSKSIDGASKETYELGEPGSPLLKVSEHDDSDSRGGVSFRERLRGGTGGSRKRW